MRCEKDGSEKQQVKHTLPLMTLMKVISTDWKSKVDVVCGSRFC